MKRMVTWMFVILSSMFIICANTTVLASDGLSATLVSVTPEVVCPGSSEAMLTVQIQGEPPFLIEYTDGQYVYSAYAETNLLHIWVMPYGTTTYSLLAVYDNYENSGDVYGSATVRVSDYPEITTDLETSTLTSCPGSSAIFSIVADGADLQYQWYKDESSIENNVTANTSTLVLNNLSSSDVGMYYCEVSSACSESSVYSNSRELQVAGQSTMTLVNDLSGGSMSVCKGSYVELSINVEGSGLQYQWRLNGIPLQHGESWVNSNVLALQGVGDENVGVYDCLVTSLCTSQSILSSSITVLLNQPITIIDQPVGVTACPGHDVVLNVNVMGSGPLYRWYKDGELLQTNEGEQFGSQLVLHAVTAKDAGEYRVRIGSECSESSIQSEIAEVHVYRDLVIEQQPSSMSVCQGSDVQLHIAVDGTYPTYQWRRNGVEIEDNPSALTATLELTNLKATATDVYDVVINSVCGQQTSEVAEISVLAPVRLEQQPQSMTACSDATIFADVVASGSVGRYQWTRNGEVLADQTLPQLQLNSVKPLMSGQYRCEVFGAAECQPTSVLTDPFQITVFAPTRIVTQPRNVITADGGSAVFFVETEGTGNTIDQRISYQWYEGHTMLIDNDRIQGANSSQLTLKTVSSADLAHNIVCVVHGECGDVTSDAALVIIPPVSILEQPSSAHVCVGSDVVLKIRATTSVDISMRYQWFKGTQQVDGATGSTLTLPRISAKDNGLYFVRLTLGDNVMVNSAPASVLALSAPAFDTGVPIQNKDMCPGSYLALRAETVAGNDLQYQWYINGIPVEGAESQMYIDYGLSPQYNGVYAVRVQNGCNSAYRVIANINVLTRTAITAQPAVQTVVREGQQLKLHVSAVGERLQYQWLLNNVVIPDGINADYITTATAADAGMYSVRVLGTCGMVTSDFALVLVSGVSGVDPTDSDPWVLSEPQPNPVVNISRIPIRMATSSHVLIQLHDVTGNLIATVFDGILDAGSTSVSCDVAALQLESGRYTISMFTDSGVVRHAPMVVVR